MCYSIVKTLLHRGHVNVNVQTLKGETPLHLAIRKNRPDIVHLLLEYGADVNIKLDGK